MKYSIKDYLVLFPNQAGKWEFKAFQVKEEAYQFLAENDQAVLVRWQVGKGKGKNEIKYPPRDTFAEAEQEMFQVEENTTPCGIYYAKPEKHLPSEHAADTPSASEMYYASGKFHDKKDHVKLKDGRWVPMGSEEHLKEKYAQYFK